MTYIHHVELLLTASQQSHTQSANGKSHMSTNVVVMRAAGRATDTADLLAT